MALLSAFYPQPVVAGTTEGTFAEGNLAAFKVGDEDIEITDATKGIIFRDSNGNRYRYRADTDGSLITDAL